jgi:hypothetical protein
VTSCIVSFIISPSVLSSGRGLYKSGLFMAIFGYSESKLDCEFKSTSTRLAIREFDLRQPPVNEL